MSHPAPNSTPSANSHGTITTSVLVIGAGIAGLSLALRLPAHLPTVVVTKGALGESNTWYAQGGLAAAVGPDDNPELHFDDTMVAGAGLSDPEAVRELVEGGPEAVQWLIARGTRFDEDAEELALGKEAAHSRNRVLHAGGDATGAEIERSLVTQLRDRPAVTILEQTTAIDLLVHPDGRCGGAILQTGAESSPFEIHASITVLANGGVGRLWAVTSNPPGATGDGIAMAMRAGVTVADLEFTQFHPTVLAVDGVEPFLITEAIRGEGAYLLDQHGERFMLPVHDLAELAPRDVVAREIQRQVTITGGKPVYLDLRHLDPELVHHRFPTIEQRLGELGLSLASDLVPVAPAAHYFMGGVVADTEGRTSMPGLYAIGEVSCTGVHGANRLASNSLLEGLVFGLRAADAIAQEAPDVPSATPAASGSTPVAPIAMGPAHDIWKQEIQGLMSGHVAVVRDGEGLGQTLGRLHDIEQAVIASGSVPVELQNLLLLAVEVTRSALAREESRGAHFRLDFPVTDPALDAHHQVVSLRDGMTQRILGPLHGVPVP